MHCATEAAIYALQIQGIVKFCDEESGDSPWLRYKVSYAAIIITPSLK